MQPGIQSLNYIFPAKLLNEKYKLFITVGHDAQYFGRLVRIAQTEVVFILSAGLFRFVDQVLKFNNFLSLI